MRIFISFITMMISINLSFAEVELDTAKQQWEDIQTEQQITTVFYAMVSGEGARRSNNLRKKAKKIHRGQINTAKIQAARTASGKSTTRANAHAAKLEKAAKKVGIIKGVHYTGTAVTGFHFFKSAYMNLVISGKIAELERELAEGDCCVNTDLEGLPSDDVDEDISDLAKPVMVNYGNQQN